MLKKIKEIKITDQDFENLEIFAAFVADFMQQNSPDSGNGGVLCLMGNLGAGKTTFTKYFAKNLGIQEFRVKSPTYTYYREYDLTFLAAPPDRFKKFYHFDFYRIEELDELLLSEIEEFWENEDNLLIIEWPERVKDYLPDQRFELKIENLASGERLFQFFAN